MTRPRRPAALRHRLQLERAALAADGATTWTSVAILYGALEPMGAREAEGGAALTGRVGHRIEIRWRPDVSGRDRLRLGDRVFRIVAAHDPDERRARLWIQAEEDAR